MQPVPSGMTRVEVSRGFYAVREGQFGVCNPGDVVDINPNDAKMLRAANKVVFVDHNTDKKLQPDYKRAAVPAILSPMEKSLAVLTDAVAALQKTSEAQLALIQQLAGGDKAKAKT